MKRTIRIGMLLLLALSLAGCGKSGSGQASDTGSNIAEVKKDGVITNTIEEDFDSRYYDEDSLKEFVLKEASSYNNETGEERVTVKKLEVKKETVTLTMEYKTAEDFGTFNGYPFFCGTIAEAYAAGYDLDLELIDAGYQADEDTAEELPSIGKEELLEMGSRRIIIVEVPAGESLTIKTSGKILYMSGAQLEKSNVAAVSADREEASKTYIVFK